MLNKTLCKVGDYVVINPYNVLAPDSGIVRSICNDGKHGLVAFSDGGRGIYNLAPGTETNLDVDTIKRVWYGRFAS